MKATLVRLLCVAAVGLTSVALLPTPTFAQAPAAAASPAKKPHNPPYRGNIDTADAAAKTFTIKGKKNTRTFTVTATTKLLKRAGGDATFADLKVGEYVTGSCMKTGENTYQAMSVKVGPKLEGAAASPSPAAVTAASPTPAPAASPAKTRKSRKKAAAEAAASPTPAQ